MPHTVDFEFRLTGTGWAEGRLSVDGSSAIAIASYLSDALGDLLRGLRKLLAGADKVGVAWQDEPGEFTWDISRLGALVRVQIQHYANDEDDLGEAEPRTLLDAQCTPRELVRAVVRGARAVLDEHGIEGYGAKWVEFPFPLDELTALEHALG